MYVRVEEQALLPDKHIVSGWRHSDDTTDLTKSNRFSHRSNLKLAQKLHSLAIRAGTMAKVYKKMNPNPRLFSDSIFALRVADTWALNDKPTKSNAVATAEEATVYCTWLTLEVLQTLRATVVEFHAPLQKQKQHHSIAHGKHNY